MGEDNDDIQLEDTENWKGGQEKQFSHQKLIMKTLELAIDYGASELKEGFWNNKIDKNGNVVKHYEEDKRKRFIEAVKTLMMITHRDFKDYPKTLKLIEEKKVLLQQRHKFWLDQEWKWWTSLQPQARQQMMNEGKNANQGFFNKNLEFDNFYYDEETSIYRDICAIICDFIKDEMNDYEGDTLIG